ncbi:MAG TPA: hypothetical protein VGC41_22755 [Kofleriaceae bacterium]
MRQRIQDEEDQKIAASTAGKTAWPYSTTAKAMVATKTIETTGVVRPAKPKPDPKPKVEKFRERLRAMWTEAIEDQGELDLKVAAKQFAEQVQADPELFELFIKETLVETVRAIGDRTVKHLDGVQQIGSIVQTVAHLREQVSSESLRVTWAELDPLSNVTVPLLKMTRAQVSAAALNRAKLADEHKKVSRWLLLIADRMAEHQTVREALSDDEILALHAAASEHPPVKISVIHRTRKAS